MIERYEHLGFVLEPLCFFAVLRNVSLDFDCHRT